MRKVIIIGSGPAGYTAAIYAARANMNPMLVEGNVSGGQLTSTTEIENFPGFPEKLKGTDLMNRMREQAESLGVNILKGQVINIEKIDSYFKVTFKDYFIFSKTVILATGANPKYLGIPSEAHYLSTGGVSACAVCDGFFYKGRDVVIVGGGDTACEEALYLAKICSSVTMILRGDKFRASKIMVERVYNNGNIKVLFNKEIIEIIGNGEDVNEVKLLDTLTSKESFFETDGVFIAIGHTPNSNFFPGELALDSQGYIKVNHPTTETSIEGLFACGDVTDPIYRQAIIAAGSGSKAALDAEKFLSKEEQA